MNEQASRPRGGAGRRVILAGAVVAVGLAVVLLGPLALPGPRLPAAVLAPVAPLEVPPSASWQAVAAPPLAPRYGSVTGWVGGRLLLLGGHDGAPCPLQAGEECTLPPALRDGALYDPVADRWDRLPDLPVGVSVRGEEPASLASSILGRVAVSAGDTVHLFDTDSTLGWRAVPSPGDDAGLVWLPGEADRLAALLPCADEAGCPARLLRLDEAGGVWLPYGGGLGFDLPAGELSLVGVPELRSAAFSVARPGQDRLWVAWADLDPDPDDEVRPVVAAKTPVPVGAAGPFKLDTRVFGWAEPGGSTLWVWDSETDVWQELRAPEGGFRWWQDGAEFSGPADTADGVLLAGSRYDRARGGWKDLDGPPSGLRDPVVVTTWLSCFGFDPATRQYAAGCLAVDPAAR